MIINNNAEDQSGWKTVGRKRTVRKKCARMKGSAGWAARLETILETVSEHEEEVYYSSEEEEAGDYRGNSLSPSPPLILKQKYLKQFAKPKRCGEERSDVNPRQRKYPDYNPDSSSERSNICSLVIKLDNIKDKDQFMRKGKFAKETAECGHCKNYLESLPSFIQYFKTRNTKENPTLDESHIEPIERDNQSRQSWRESRVKTPENVLIAGTMERTNDVQQIPKAVKSLCPNPESQEKPEVLPPYTESQREEKLRLMQKNLDDASAKCKDLDDKFSRMLVEVKSCDYSYTSRLERLLMEVDNSYYTYHQTC